MRVELQQRWNDRRGAVTYRLSKQGTNSFLLLGADDLADLQKLITQATGGRADDAPH